MRFVIVGPGALGSVIGAILSRRGHDVTLLGRQSPHLEPYANKGCDSRRRTERADHVSRSRQRRPRRGQSSRDGDRAGEGRGHGPGDGYHPTVHPCRSDHTDVTKWPWQCRKDPVRAGRRATSPGRRHIPGRDAARPGAVRHAGEGPTLIGVLDKRDSSAAAELARIFTESGLPSAPYPTSSAGSGGNLPSTPQSMG